MPSGVSRQLAAPTVEKFKEQDLKIQEIEATLKEVQQQQASIKKDNQQLRKDVQVEVAAVRSDLGSFTSEGEYRGHESITSHSTAPNECWVL